MSVPQLEKVHLLQAPVEVVSWLRPGVSIIMLLLVGIRVCETDRSRAGVNIGEGVKDMSELGGVDVLRLKISSVDSPM